MVEALDNDKWIDDIRGTLTMDAIIEYLDLWRRVRMQPPLNNLEDEFSWCLTSNGIYSVSSTYHAFFFGTEGADYAKRLWKNDAPPKRVFIHMASHKKPMLDR